jgi:hypothetical protein
MRERVVWKSLLRPESLRGTEQTVGGRKEITARIEGGARIGSDERERVLWKSLLRPGSLRGTEETTGGRKGITARIEGGARIGF